MTWNVYVEDFNGRQIRTHDVFNHARLREDLKKLVRKCKDDRETFEKELRHCLMYYYWSKCEWEIVLSSWPPSSPAREFRDKKIDVWDQVSLNWERFADYVWENRKEALKWKTT